MFSGVYKVPYPPPLGGEFIKRFGEEYQVGRGEGKGKGEGKM